MAKPKATDDVHVYESHGVDGDGQPTIEQTVTPVGQPDGYDAHLEALAAAGPDASAADVQQVVDVLEGTATPRIWQGDRFIVREGDRNRMMPWKIIDQATGKVEESRATASDARAHATLLNETRGQQS